MRQAVLGVALGLAVSGCAPGGSDPAEQPALATVVAGTLTACVTPGAGLAPPAGDALEAFDRAVLAALADELALALEVRPTDLDDVVAGVALANGACDVAAAAVVDSAGLVDVATTSAPYHRVHRLVLGSARGPAVAPAAVTGRVGIEEAGPAIDATNGLPAADVVTYPSRADLARALAAGAVDLVVVPVEQRAAVEDELGRASVVRAVVPTADATVLLFPLDADPDLVTAVDDELGALAASGRLETLGDELLHR